jgi:hypothetical protein
MFNLRQELAPDNAVASLMRVTLGEIFMPSPSMITARLGAFLAAMLAASSPSVAQSLPPPLAGATPATPLQAQALTAFRPHVEQLCKALYGRPNAAESCIQRVLDAALPLDLEPTAAPAREVIVPRAETREGTVAPDGRE